jgi:hypothetical protein
MLDICVRCLREQRELEQLTPGNAVHGTQFPDTEGGQEGSDTMLVDTSIAISSICGVELIATIIRLIREIQAPRRCSPVADPLDLLVILDKVEETLAVH